MFCAGLLFANDESDPCVASGKSEAKSMCAASLRRPCSFACQLFSSCVAHVWRLKVGPKSVRLVAYHAPQFHEFLAFSFVELSVRNSRNRLASLLPSFCQSCLHDPTEYRLTTLPWPTEEPTHADKDCQREMFGLFDASLHLQVA